LAGRKTEAEAESFHMTHPKRPRDPNQLAKSIIDIATGQKPDRDPPPEEQGPDFSVNQAISFWGHFSN